MHEILYINACVREQSRTKALAEHLLSKLDGNVTEICLNEIECQPLDEQRLIERDTALAEGNLDAPILHLARQFAAADEIVIAAPFWDLSIPALLKCYLENVSVCGVTFRYGENGKVIGLCRAKRMFVVMTSGGPCIKNYGIDYIRALAKNLYGIETVEDFTAEGLDIIGNDPSAILAQTAQKIDDFTV